MYGAKCRATLIALLLLFGSACSSTPATYGGFRGAFDAGASCAELFKIRNAMRKSDADNEDAANIDLRSVRCTSPSAARVKILSYDDFVQALNDGADCDRLFAIKNSLAQRDAANLDLRRIGCNSATDKRINTPTGAEGLYPVPYKGAYFACSGYRDPTRRAELFRESGTNDNESAARWLAQETNADWAQESGYQGCLDALEGRSNRFDQ